jgi:hypothetical protein
MQTTTRENSVPVRRQCTVKDCDPLCLRIEGWIGQSGRRGHENNVAQLIVSYHIQQVSLRSLSYHFVFNETTEKVFVALQQSQFPYVITFYTRKYRFYLKTVAQSNDGILTILCYLKLI